ncbi:cbb3-type cytochrome c oxidase subunit 3 [Siculibacillus lacustris]|uniref:Cbb3-type cytochrome c oxidase subunit 3 n=1 Tax=Siculibacillus lacustris TaxID=1549641 RepID=A0A4Q9VNE5_9HYPH|nr:cbb3-type cytochrome c oxidase subunit 3 [Siculibacillus lacustris]TBW37178.1 cbb3-type cytochrome c oxidase subunit 3 [Siculibacillus lacustris]
MSSYASVAQFAQTWGLVYFFVIFAGVLAYALWPSNRRSFDEASRIPLRED